MRNIISREKLISKENYYSSAIKNEGGDNLKTKPFSKEDMEFVESATIPKLRRGKTGKDWLKLLKNIPIGKAWKLPKDFASGATVRSAVKTINKEHKEIAFEVTQRTNKETEEVTVYVKRLK